MIEQVDHPLHYGGKDNLYEVIKVIEAWELGFHLGNAIKYIGRAGKKLPMYSNPTGGDTAHAALKDLQKARWYLNREIENLEQELSEPAASNTP